MALIVRHGRRSSPMAAGGLESRTGTGSPRDQRLRGNPAL